MKSQTKEQQDNNSRKKKQVRELIYTAIIMAVGLLLFKLVPMEIFGKAILFDASMHITAACFILYAIYFFIDQNKNWRIPYFMFCVVVLAIISEQRILANAHDDVGLLLGLILSLIAIVIPRYNEIKGRIQF